LEEMVRRVKEKSPGEARMVREVEEKQETTYKYKRGDVTE